MGIKYDEGKIEPLVIGEFFFSGKRFLFDTKMAVKCW